MQLPDASCEGSSNEPAALQKRADEHNPTSAEYAYEYGDNRRNKHRDGEVEAANEGEVPR
jgi:hypothetical protein